jgi:uncharacterized protein
MRVRCRAIVLFAAVLLAGCAGVGAPPTAEQGIMVSGSGRVARPPDTAVVEVGVEARAAQLAAATAEVDRRMRDVLERVKALGDLDVRTTAYEIEPVGEPRQPGDTSTRIVGYRVTNVVQARTRRVEGLGRIVDAAVSAGANVVRNVQFTIDAPERAEAEARTLAMQDAAGKARQVAAAAGVRLGRLLSVSESSPGRPVMLSRMPMGYAPGPVEAGQLEVIIVVQTRYAIEP